MIYFGCTLLGIVFGALITYIFMKNSFQKENKQNIEELSKLQAQIKAQEDFRNLIKEDFSKLAVQTINEQQEDLRKQNREILDDKLKPLNESLLDFKKQVAEFQEAGNSRKKEIMKEIDDLKTNSSKLSEDAQNLTKALTMNQNIKGAYGEDLLDVILQIGGLQENINYTKQFNTTSVNNKDEIEHKIKPDFVINLPNEKHLIIDSKLTLTSYLEYEENPKSETKEKFKQAVKTRIKELAEKNYQNAQGINQPDFILLFMPIENCVGMIYSDKDFGEILQYAYNSNIIIIGSASLLTVIRLVNQLWAIQKQSENSNKIAQAGINLYETFEAFCQNLKEIQDKFNDVSNLFKTTINRFKRKNDKNPSLFSQIEILKKEYKINTTKQIPAEFLTEDEIFEAETIEE